MSKGRTATRKRASRRKVVCRGAGAVTQLLLDRVGAALQAAMRRAERGGMNFIRRSFLAVVVCLLVTGAALTSAGTASARDCGTWGDLADGAYASTDAFGSASCGFAQSAADQFWSRSGVPRRVRLRGTVLRYRSHRSGDTWQFWFYAGIRKGRVASVAFTQWDVDEGVQSSGTYAPPTAASSGTYMPQPTTPTIPYAGRGYPVVCADGWLSHSGGIQGACSYHGGIG
jgi:hypothetical protein